MDTRVDWKGKNSAGQVEKGMSSLGERRSKGVSYQRVYPGASVISREGAESDIQKARVK